MAEWTERDYDKLVEKHGQQAVDEADDALSAMYAAGRSLSEVARERISEEGEEIELSRARERHQRWLDRAEERVVDMAMRQRHPALLEMMESDPALRQVVEDRFASQSAVVREPAEQRRERAYELVAQKFELERGLAMDRSAAWGRLDVEHAEARLRLSLARDGDPAKLATASAEYDDIRERKERFEQAFIDEFREREPEFVAFKEAQESLHRALGSREAPTPDSVLTAERRDLEVQAQAAYLAYERRAEPPAATLGSPERPIEIGHSAAQQMAYALNGTRRAAETAEARPVPGSPERPIEIGHSIEQQMRYGSGASASPRRTVLDRNPDQLALFEELYSDVVRTADNVPLGSLRAHAEGRLQQSFAALKLIEQARSAGIISEDAEIVATGARVQDKSASLNYPAAHRLPCDLSVKHQGATVRLADYFENGLDRAWVNGEIFAPTDRVHRLANVADKWCEDAGMRSSLVKASNAVLHGRMDARTAMDEIIQPGYADAIQRAKEKVGRNFSIIERQTLSQRVLGADGKPLSKGPEPQFLNVKDMPSRAAAKGAMERTLTAYGEVKELSAEQRMMSAIAVTGVINNERQFGSASGNTQRALPRGAARVEAELATRDARRRMSEEMDPIKQLAAKAKEAATAAGDVTRPMSSRLRSMNDASTYSDRMKVAWAGLQKERGPEILEGMRSRLSRCGGEGETQYAELKSTLAAPPRFVTDVAMDVEDSREAIMRTERLDEERRAREREDRDNIVHFSPRP